jgi:hypothetical protein
MKKNKKIKSDRVGSSPPCYPLGPGKGRRTGQSDMGLLRYVTCWIQTGPNLCRALGCPASLI